MNKIAMRVTVVLMLIMPCFALIGCGKQTPETYTLTYAAGTGGTVTGSLNQTVEKGKDGSTVTAAPNSGYVFSVRSDGVTTAARTDKNVVANVSATAEFTLVSDTDDGLGELRTVLSNIKEDLKNVRIMSEQTVAGETHDALIEIDGNIIFSSQYWDGDLSEGYLERTETAIFIYDKDEETGEWYKRQANRNFDEVEVFVILPTCLSADFFRAEADGYVMTEESVDLYLQSMNDYTDGNIIFIDTRKPVSVRIKIDNGRLIKYEISFTFAEDGKTLFTFHLTFSDYGEITLTLPSV